MYHEVAIESSPLQAYTLALLFSPTSSAIRKLSQPEESKLITLKPAMSDSCSACLQTIEGHGSLIDSIAFSHDSAWLASSLGDYTIKIWDIGSGACLPLFEGHKDGVWSLAFSHDLTRLASAAQDDTVKIWNTSSGACLQTLDISTQHIAFDSTGPYLYTDSGIVAIDASSHSKVVVANTPQSIDQGLGLSSDGIWNTYNAQNLLWLPPEYRPGCSVVSAKYIGIGVGTGKVWIYRVDQSAFS
jgi:WD40 repeat protein